MVFTVSSVTPRSALASTHLFKGKQTLVHVGYCLTKRNPLDPKGSSCRPTHTHAYFYTSPQMQMGLTKLTNSCTTDTDHLFQQMTAALRPICTSSH